LVKLDGELAELKRALAHLDLGLKAYKTAALAQTDADRLLSSCRDEVVRIAAAAGEAEKKIKEALGQE
jgi:hypothetical protein